MSWSEKLICRILLLIARMVCDDDDMRKELTDLRNHISCSSVTEMDV